MRDADSSTRFWNEVKHLWGQKGAEHLKQLYDLFAAGPHKIEWGSANNKHASFTVTAPEFAAATYFRVYSDAMLHFYTCKLPADHPAANAFRERIDRFAESVLDANVDNTTLYLVNFERWIGKSGELKDFFHSLFVRL